MILSYIELLVYILDLSLLAAQRSAGVFY